MEIYDNCDFMPKFLVDDRKVFLPCSDSFVADHIDPDDKYFDIQTVNGVDYYPLRWLQKHSWLPVEVTQAFGIWAEENGIDVDFHEGGQGVTWVTKDGELPEYVRTIGFADDGDAYVAVDSIDLPKGGLEAKTTIYLGKPFISVHDWVKVDPKGFGETILSELLPLLAEKHECKCNPFG
jgi:hypothetical protein